MDGRRSRNNNYSLRVHSEKGYRRGRGSYTYDRGAFRGRYKYINRPSYPYRNNITNNKYFHNKPNKRVPSRPASPVEGSEEYMNRKIEHTSAIIMRQLLNPTETITPSSSLHNKTDEHSKKTDLDKTVVINDNTNLFNKKSGDKLANKTRKNVTIQLNAKEIHEKIMNHITNLNNGRKRNFINANSSTGLDNAINHMQKQKRLEISRILRDMSSSSDFQDFTDYTSSIVPDIGIEIGELPIDVIEELRQTLNLDLEHLNEAIADSRNYDDTCSASSGSIEFLNDIVQVKREPQNVEYEPIKNPDIIEIKTEDISDISEERVAEPRSVQVGETPKQSQNSEEIKQSLHHEVVIKSDQDLDSETSSLEQGELYSQSTNVFRRKSAHTENNIKTMAPNTDNDPVSIKTENSDDPLRLFESNIRKFVESEKNPEYVNIDTILANIDLIDMCVKHLSSYRRLLIQSIANKNKDVSNSNSANEKSITKTTQQDETSKKVVKKRKLMDRRQGDVPTNIEIKQEPLEIQTILRFPKLDEKIIAIERVDNELVLATDKGNIIFVSLEDGTFTHRLEVSECTITSMKFVRGINNFIYMYIGSLEPLLRVFDFRKRQIISTSHIDDQIRCMDSMWDYVFMGCKKGTLIRYSCKKEKIEFVENNTYKDVLVLQAAQEGPRRVLLIGHRHAEIYVRDAMSGLFLRSFGSTAVTPTVYSIVISQNNLYCGTAKDNILVFAFHEGQLKRKIVADDSKGISCLKIYGNHLFAGCYNGSIYIYNLDGAKLLLVLKGPGGSIVCMEVLNNQIIVGTLTGQLHSLSLPSDIFKY